jgi:hypothetical protein
MGCCFFQLRSGFHFELLCVCEKKTKIAMSQNEAETSSRSRLHPIVCGLLQEHDEVLLQHAAGCCGIDYSNDVLGASPTHDFVRRDEVFECQPQDEDDESSPPRSEQSGSAGRHRAEVDHRAVLVLPARLAASVDEALLRRLVPHHPNKRAFSRQLARAFLSDQTATALDVNDLAASDTASNPAGGRMNSTSILQRPLTSNELVELTLAVDRFNSAQRLKEATLLRYSDVCKALREQEEQCNAHATRRRHEQQEHQQRSEDAKAFETLLLLERQAIAQKMALRDKLHQQEWQAQSEREEELKIARACIISSERARAQARAETARRQRAEEDQRAKDERMRLQAEMAERSIQEQLEAAGHRKFLLLHSREATLRQKCEARRQRLESEAKRREHEREQARCQFQAASEQHQQQVRNNSAKRKEQSGAHSEASARREAAYERASEAERRFIHSAEAKAVEYAHRVQHQEMEQRRRQLQAQREAEEAQQHRAHALLLARARAEARRQEAQELFALQEARRQETAQTRDVQRKLLEAEGKAKEDERKERIARAARAREYRDQQFRLQLEAKGSSESTIASVIAPRRPAASAGPSIRGSGRTRPSTSGSYTTMRRHLVDIKGKGATLEAASALDQLLQDIHNQMQEIRERRRE